MEMYLNVVEFGPGVYGAEAASEHVFHKHASELSAGGGRPPDRRPAQAARMERRRPQPLRRAAAPNKVDRAMGTVRNAGLADCVGR